MTTFVIDAELQASDASFVVGTGSYTVTGLPTSSPLSNQWFAFPAGVVVAGGKEVWEYDQVVPIDDYAALGPREAPGETYATPWPEDEMVSADMHFNLGLHVKQHSEILEDHERRIRDNEAQIALLTEFINKLLALIGLNLIGNIEGENERECLPGDYSRFIVIGQSHVDWGWHPSAEVLRATWCKNSQGKTFGASKGATAFYDAPLNTVASMLVSNNGTDEQRGNSSIPLSGAIGTEDAPHSGAHPDFITSNRYTWMSEEFNGDPLPPVSQFTTPDGIIEHGFSTRMDWFEVQPSTVEIGWIVGTQRKQFHTNMLLRGFNYCGGTYGGVISGTFAPIDGSKWDGKFEDYSC